jgi:putative FmdB family regulatory protein
MSKSLAWFMLIEGKGNTLSLGIGKKRQNHKVILSGGSMVLYEYQCDKCGHSFKKLFFICKNVGFTCPRCGDGRVKKLLDYISLTGDDKIAAWSDRIKEVFP